MSGDVSSAGADRPQRLSAGFVIVRRTAAGWRYLLLRAYRNWDFPKGQVEPGEPALDAALRELAEETGIAQPALDWGPVIFDTERYGRGKIARFHLGRVDSDEVVLGLNPELGRPEHHEYRWLTRAAARALLVPRLQAVLDWAAQRVEGAPAAADPS
jgi:bis(5'-nucleosidyl)-tetraphosphatase